MTFLPNGPAALEQRCKMAEDSNIFLAAEVQRLRGLLRSMVESYDIVMSESPVGAHPVPAGIVRGAFITIIDRARDAAECGKEG
jgi:hypothetical protein